jgi:PAS domain S-box-containing protein
MREQNHIPEVLIVDDEVANRILFAEAVSDLDIHCILVESGEECIELMKTGKEYVLVLLDIKMPGINGFEVLDIIRNELKSDVPVILISAIFNSVQDMILGIEKGAMDLLSKPVNLTILKHKVLNFIRLFEKKQELNESVDALQSLSKQLQEKENRIRKITDAVGDAIAVIDQHGKILFWNQSAKRIFGYSKYETINENILDLLISEKSYNLLESLIKSFSTDSKKHNTEQIYFIHAKNKLGIEFPFELTITAYKKDKENYNFVLVLRDLTKYQKLEKEVKKIKELKEANKIMREFVDNVSHEMRTPMNAILGISKMMLKYNSDNLSKKQLEGLDIIKVSGTRLLDLINDVLDLSKIDSGNIKINNELFNYNKFLSLLKSITHNLIGDKKIKFIVKKSKGIPLEIVADQKKINQILLNIIGNSVKFTEKGKIILTTHIIGDQLFFEVTDTGIGIKKEELDSIFGKFVQADNSVSKKYKGTGLGLHITKKLIELLDGKISIESKVNLGTTIRFYIKLPSQSNAVNQDTTLEDDIYGNIEILSYSSDNPLVLIIDDNLQNAFIYYHLHEHDNLSILHCKDGKSGIKALHRYIPDFVIVKLELSDLYGLNIVNEIIKKYPDIKIIAISEYDDRPPALNSKIAFIGEPINNKALVENLRNFTKYNVKIQTDIAILYKRKTTIKPSSYNNAVLNIDIDRPELAIIDFDRRKVMSLIIEDLDNIDSIISFFNQLNKSIIDSFQTVIVENKNNNKVSKKLKTLFKNIKQLDKNQIIEEIQTLKNQNE